MRKYFYFAARLIKRGVYAFTSGIFTTEKGYFDFVDAADMIAEQEEIDIKDVVITFWAETNSIMYGKFKGRGGL